MQSLVILAGWLQLAAPRTVATRTIEIPAFDGVPVAATYYDPGAPGPGVLVFRNCDQKRAGVDAFARQLAAHGMHVIAHDYRDGVASGRDWSGTRLGDAERVHDWLVAQPGVDSTRLGVIGGSCGVALVMDFFSAHPSTTRALVILSGPSDSSHHALVRQTSSAAILGAASIEEGAAVGYIDVVVRASRHAASRMFALRGAGHGTDILRSASFRDTALTWLQQRLDAAPARRQEQ